MTNASVLFEKNLPLTKNSALQRNYVSEMTMPDWSKRKKLQNLLKLPKIILINILGIRNAEEVTTSIEFRSSPNSILIIITINLCAADCNKVSLSKSSNIVCTIKIASKFLSFCEVPCCSINSFFYSILHSIIMR